MCIRDSPELEFWTPERIEEINCLEKWKLNCGRKACCQCYGHFGGAWFWERRGMVLGLIMVVEMICLVLAVLACVGLSGHGHAVKALPWATYESTALDPNTNQMVHYDVYINLEAARYESDTGASLTVSLSEVKHQVEESGSTGSVFENIEDCADASSSCQLIVVLVCVLHPLTICTILNFWQHPHGCTKLEAATSASIGNSIFALINVSEFSSKCYSDISGADLGTGFGCMIAFCVLQLAFVVPLLSVIPTPPVPPKPCEGNDEHKCLRMPFGEDQTYESTGSTELTHTHGQIPEMHMKSSNPVVPI
eukprot:TRINITY_DN2706_c0_g1_i1.p1 TRINITY_DN2706_c0_g1~~TRINITY_DN2706_c0_g1_i1.p1  ORF type:complete len:308 (+),score=66.98 TRINITY_DN2706_c0_g1_i1:95-1018(+)